MPALPRIIGVKVPAGTAGEYVRIRNNTRGGTLTAKLSSSLEVKFDPENSGLQWVNGDDLVIEMSGRVAGVKAVKMAGGVNITLDVTADTTTPEVNL